MRVLIHVVAMDEERGVKCTHEDTIDVPGKVLKLHEMLGGGNDEILRRVCQSVFAGAHKELVAGRVDMQRALMETEGGRIGGRGREVREEEEPEQAPPARRAPKAAPKAQPRTVLGDAPRTSSLGDMLGLDLIQHQVRTERPAPQAGPGPIGFGRGRR